MTERLVERLAAVAVPGAREGGAPLGADLVVLADRPDGTVVRSGGVVVKAHGPGTDAGQLAARLRTAAHPLLRGILLAPLSAPGSGPGGPAEHPRVDGRPTTLWPCGVPVDPDAPEAVPWAEAGALLAGLHAVPAGRLPGPLPPMGGPRKVARALDRMRRRTTAPYAGAVAVVERAAALLPGWARGEEPPPRADALCHGDVHLGQLVRHPAPDGPWQLIDVDDLGLGPAAWDLARPAAWYATGLLAPADWESFLGAYRAAGGSALSRTGSGRWPEEAELPARALTVQSAAVAVIRASGDGRPLDEIDRALVDACDRMAGRPPGRTSGRVPGAVSAEGVAGIPRQVRQDRL